MAVLGRESELSWFSQVCEWTEGQNTLFSPRQKLVQVYTSTEEWEAQNNNLIHHLLTPKHWKNGNLGLAQDYKYSRCRTWMDEFDLKSSSDI